MVYNLRQFLVVLTLIASFHGSKCDAEFQKYRLGRVVDNIIEEKSQIRIDNNGNKYQISYDIDCVKNFFNFPQNNKMMVGQFEEMFFVLAARTKCWDEEKAFALLENTHITISSRVKIHCVKFYLQRLEPTSKLVENFMISDYEAEKCKRLFRTEEYLEIQKFFESELGPLSDYSCGALSKNAADDYFKFYCKGILIQKGDYSEELRKTEKKNLMEYFKNVAVGTVSCAIKRFEADPQAYIANNTLNYYYKNRLEKDDANTYKKLQKVEEAIDYNCVEDKLNLPKIGSQAFSVAETKILIASAKSKCIKVDDLTFSNLFIDFIMDDHDYSGRYISCSKLKLHDIEPESRLTIGASEYESEREHCDYYEIRFQTYSVPTWTYKEQVGRLNETTCGIITDNTEDLIALKTLLISNESNEEVKVSETKELFKYVTGKLQNLADCILERNRLEN